MAETESLLDATSSSTDELAGIAGNTGETGSGFVAPPPASTTGDLGSGTFVGGITSSTLNNVAGGVDPTPTAGTLDLGSVDQGEDQTTQQTNDTSRDPVQEGQNQENVPGTAEAQIRIVIRRPGGEQ